MGKIKISESEYEKIVNMYKNNMSSVEIGELYECSYRTILRILEKCNINRDWNSLRKYTINEHYFDIIDTPNKAYILGLLYADGYNNTDTNCIRIGLQERDKQILIDISKELEYDAPLVFCQYSTENNNRQNIYSLVIRSSHISNILDKAGMVKGKSIILEFPNWLTESLYPHFIRGYFDGDGSIYCYQKKMNWNISIVSTTNFCNCIQTIIQNILGVHSHVKLDGRHNNITSDLRIGGNQQVLKFLNWIYQDADIKLDRKYNKYQQFLSNYNINNSSVA